jgi:hypothetical protein
MYHTESIVPPKTHVTHLVACVTHFEYVNELTLRYQVETGLWGSRAGHEAGVHGGAAWSPMYARQVPLASV